jgi:23S rRNA pseudouridine2605 synthase
MSEKLQKVLSRLGIASRRGIEKMIADGRVSCNGVIAKIGDRVEADKVQVAIDGRVVLSPSTQKPQCRVLMYHKPEGELTTLNDPEDRPTVFDHLPKPDSGRWIYVGRLDINTSGLLLFTTDGDLANALMHPRHGIERIYASRIYGEVTEEMLEQLRNGVTLEDGPAHFDKITFVGGEARNAWYHVSLKEGRKREVRRLWEAVGVKVSRLIRISYGGIELDPALKAGQYRELTLREMNRLRSLADMPAMTIEDMPTTPLVNVTESSYKARISRAKAQSRRPLEASANRPRVPGSLGNAKYENSRKAVLEDRDNRESFDDNRAFERKPSANRNRSYGDKPFNKGRGDNQERGNRFERTKRTGDSFSKRSANDRNFEGKERSAKPFEGRKPTTRWERGPAFLDKNDSKRPHGGFNKAKRPQTSSEGNFGDFNSGFDKAKRPFSKSSGFNKGKRPHRSGPRHFNNKGY